MTKYQNKYRIESTRLSEYNYSQSGAYFVTICTHSRMNFFGEIREGEVHLNAYGKIVFNVWHQLPLHYPNLILDEIIIMPNHIHCIMIISNIDKKVTDQRDVETGLRPVSTGNYQFKQRGLSEFVRALKSFSSKKINEYRKSTFPEIWQKRFYEHIIRNDKELNAIRNYIIYNPLNWEDDEYFNN